MSAIDRYPDDSVEKKEQRDPESAVDDAGNESDGVLSFTALIEEGGSQSKYLSKETANICSR
jgi:hypothetical protein